MLYLHPQTPEKKSPLNQMKFSELCEINNIVIDFTEISFQLGQITAVTQELVMLMEDT